MTTITISIPDALKAEITQYNKDNPYNKLPISVICQQAIVAELEKRKGSYNDIE